jgi:hypothetical protein
VDRGISSKLAPLSVSGKVPKWPPTAFSKTSHLPYIQMKGSWAIFLLLIMITDERISIYRRSLHIQKD